jgi:hypothetical protein
MSNVHELIDAIVDGDTISIQNKFNAEMSERLSTVLDVYRTEVAKSLFKADQEEPQEQEE